MSEIDLASTRNHPIVPEMGASDHVVPQPQGSATRVRDRQSEEHCESAERRCEHDCLREPG
jgi:hypothetical protein